MMKQTLVLAATVGAFAFGLPANAQYTSGKIVFKNAGSYAQEDLEAVGGVHVGQKVSTAALQASAQKLIDTGYFDDVGVGVLGPVANLTVTFGLKPFDASRFTPVGFENFVWFTPEELTAALHKGAPLFRGGLPDAGNQVDAIQAALQTALASKGITAAVAHEILEPSTSQPRRVIEYRVDTLVRVHSATLSGVPPEFTDAQSKAVARARRAPFNEGLQGVTTEAILLAPYRDAGFLDSKLAEVHRTISAAAAGTADVDLTARLDTGSAYHVSSFTFAGTPLIAADVVMRGSKLHAGDVASNALLLEALKPIDAAYLKAGYMDVYVDPQPKLDTAAHTVAYDVRVVPGEVYRVGALNIVGLPPAARAQFDLGWMMKPGEAYNAQYVKDFLTNNTALRGLQGYTGAFEASADPQTRKVDLTIKFVGGGPRR